MSGPPDSWYFGDLIRITLQVTPDGYHAKGELLAPPLVGCWVAANRSTALGAIRELFRLAENMADQEQVKTRLAELLEASK